MNAIEKMNKVSEITKALLSVPEEMVQTKLNELAPGHVIVIENNGTGTISGPLYNFTITEYE